MRISKLRDYLLEVLNSLDGECEQINVNYLDKDVNNYSIDKIPTETIIEVSVTGERTHREVYSFRSKVPYTQEVMNNMANVGFFEAFEDKIRNNNDNGVLPEIDGITDIACLNCGTLVSAETNTAIFDIQIEIIWEEE